MQKHLSSIKTLSKHLQNEYMDSVERFEKLSNIAFGRKRVIRDHLVFHLL